MENMMKIF
jgi:hypothetical protein